MLPEEHDAVFVCPSPLNCGARDPGTGEWMSGLGVGGGGKGGGHKSLGGYHSITGTVLRVGRGIRYRQPAPAPSGMRVG